MGLLLLSDSLSEANTRFLEAARHLPRLGASAEAAARLGAVAGIAAAAFQSLIQRIDQWGFPASANGGQAKQAPGLEPGTNHEAPNRGDRETDRLARAFRESVGRDLLRAGGKPDIDLEGEIRTRLQTAGADPPTLDATVAAIARRLRENVEADVRERSLRQNISEPKARQALLADVDRQAEPRRESAPGPAPAEVISGKELFDRLLIAGFSRPQEDRIAEAQLREQEKINAKLEAIKELAKRPKPSTGATFARGRP